MTHSSGTRWEGKAPEEVEERQVGMEAAGRELRWFDLRKRPGVEEEEGGDGSGEGRDGAGVECSGHRQGRCCGGGLSHVPKQERGSPGPTHWSHVHPF